MKKRPNKTLQSALGAMYLRSVAMLALSWSISAQASTGFSPLMLAPMALTQISLAIFIGAIAHLGILWRQERIGVGWLISLALAAVIGALLSLSREDLWRWVIPSFPVIAVWFLALMDRKHGA